MQFNNSMILLVIFSVCLILERFFPLRKTRESWNRILSNIFLSGIAIPFTKLMGLPLILFMAFYVENNKWGMFNILKLNEMSNHLPAIILGFFILDYAHYWWHVINHKVTMLWRFHQVHHTDRDMDVSTALRFHFGELLISALLRCIVILITGLQIETIILFDLTVTGITLFHHSNLILPKGIEKYLSLLFVTPLYHQNHHSYILEETNSNFATIFSFWDRFHRTFTKQNLPTIITIGHPGFKSDELQFFKLIKMPLQELKKWPANLLKRN